MVYINYNAIIIGRTGDGKTYFGVNEACQLLRKRHRGKTNVQYAMSNFPIIHKVYGASYRFSIDMIGMPLQDCFIVNDEAWQSLGQHAKKSYTLDREAFFATIRHSNVGTLNIAHGMTRINKDVRDKSNMFYLVKKVALPSIICERPFWFKIYGYERHDFMDSSTVEPVRRFDILFRKDTAEAYDSRYLRAKPFNMELLPKWHGDKELADIEDTILHDALTKNEQKDIKDTGYISAKRVNKNLNGGEVTDWSNKMTEQDMIDFIAK